MDLEGRVRLRGPQLEKNKMRQQQRGGGCAGFLFPWGQRKAAPPTHTSCPENHARMTPPSGRESSAAACASLSGHHVMGGLGAVQRGGRSSLGRFAVMRQSVQRQVGEPPRGGGAPRTAASGPWPRTPCGVCADMDMDADTARAAWAWLG